MQIEVTKKTFYKALDSSDFKGTDSGEGYFKEYYHNEDNEQRGTVITNYQGSTPITQYYLTDINA